MRITSIYDNEGKTLDRYTIVTDEKQGKFVAMLGLSAHPTDYNGFSQWSTGTDGPHLGKRVQFEYLTALLQNHIAARVFEPVQIASR